ncbi:hypothetical protein V1517DRAFT_351014 [Lipomyces orientalis]|uniref:Uncharacterized protein n=1 Tax=Lipomyces orientalis TaxID=1233043 RepID=A0ACC3TUP7_9ASCO
MADGPHKFEYKSISSTFAPQPPPPPTTTTPTTAETPEQRSARLVQDLKKASARAKRFGTDATEVDKLILRAEKFGTDAVTVRNAIAALDKPLVDTRPPRPTRRGRPAGPYERTTSSAATAREVPATNADEKEKLRKRQERFATK